MPSTTESRTNHYNVRSLILAEDLDNIAIVGRGTLDGSGGACSDSVRCSGSVEPGPPGVE